MTVVNRATGELLDAPSFADVRDSIATAKASLEAAAEQIVWQIENRAWLVLGYESWNEMREAEYGGAAFMVPRAERPELVARMRRSGLTQQEIAATAGVSVGTVNSDLNFSSENEPAPAITNARGQQRPASYAKTPAPSGLPSGHEAKVGQGAPDGAGHDTVSCDVKAGVAHETPDSEPEMPEAEFIDIVSDLTEAEFEDALSQARDSEDLSRRAVADASARSAGPKPVVNDIEWTDRDRAEELAANLAAHVSMLYALTDPERRAEYIALWHLGVDHRPVLGQKYVEPKTMRRIADALRTFATEWEQARV